MDNWTTIESDPGVFSELIEKFGVSDVEVNELYSLDTVLGEGELSHGLVYLFKWRDERDERPVCEDVWDLFFAKQVVQNACATIAILNILLNSSESLDLGDTLREFKGFAQEFDAESRGLAIGSLEAVRTAHNSFARAEPFVSDGEKPKKDEETEDAFHFVAFVPFQGKVYELDGLKAGPICLGEVPEGSDQHWWQVAKSTIEAKMARHSAEITSVLLSICKKKATVLQERITELSARMGEENVSASIASLQSELQEEHAKLKQQREDNVRRRFNFTPFILELVKILASKNKLAPMVEAGRARQAELSTARRERKALGK